MCQNQIRSSLVISVQEDGWYFGSQEVEEVLLGQVKLLQSPPVGGGKGGVQLPTPGDIIIIMTSSHSSQ